MTTWKLTVKVLSPLHIGSGEELHHGFDYIIYKNNTCRLNEDAVLDAKQKQLIPNKYGNYPLPGELLTDADYDDPSLFRYILPGCPRSDKKDSRMKACIKDVYDRPYLPGSSIKGAMRTALAWTGWQEVNPIIDVDKLHPDKKRAGQETEKRLFGKNPNLDLFRALHISDCFGPQTPGGRLAVINAQVLTHSGGDPPIELEAIRGDTSFQGSLKIDENLFTPEAEKRLHLSSRRHWLDELMPRIQAHSHARIEELLEWFNDQEESIRIARFYEKLASLELGKNRALMQLGWGTGWDGKTFGSHLKKDEYQFEDIIKKYDLQKLSKYAPTRQFGDPFPCSRRVVLNSKNEAEYPLAPFGWVLLEMEEA